MTHSWLAGKEGRKRKEKNNDNKHQEKRELCDVLKHPTVRAAVLKGKRCQKRAETGGQKH